MNQVAAVFLILIVSGCSVTRPCSDGGDVSWNPKIVGDKRCDQKELPNGKTVNHGQFKQGYQTTGTIALEGNFDEGKKDGIWAYYAEDSHLMAVKYFEKGVEKAPSLEAQKKIDLLIQQKTGMR